MVYTVEFDINQFNFWGGAKGTIAELEAQDRMKEAQGLIEDLSQYEEEPMTETQVNDLVWFELPDMMELYND